MFFALIVSSDSLFHLLATRLVKKFDLWVVFGFISLVSFGLFFILNSLFVGSANQEIWSVWFWILYTWIMSSVSRRLSKVVRLRLSSLSLRLSPSKLLTTRVARL